jgi:hypothetical protein
MDDTRRQLFMGGEHRFQGVEDSKGGQERRSSVLAGQVTQGKFISS